ncbi:MAG: SusC/RagA family TonB-linked outer membrane protein [Emticicia sp.]|uniref:SusC/RagA family TonB-linked outer membrane protein n=1 Tax=Emticicia sp. TaxID=1930953 RepID=UPI003BA49311
MKHTYPIPILVRALMLLLFFTSSMVFAQKKITGKVLDAETGVGLPGATIQIKGSNKGTSSDANGAFSLDVSAGSTLVISSIGYVSVEESVGNRSTIDVKLNSDAKALSEVVVTGYGSQSKKDITGAVATVNMKDVLAVPATNLAQAIQGRVAGVNVSNENSPGGGVMVRIRGFGTINDNSPLYVIDGTPTKGNLNTLNLNDIESMQVLKDASAASIYGSRAGNGVVIITTKKGKGGKPKLTYDMYYGSQRPIKFLDLLNTQQYADLLWESRINAENPSLLVDGKISDPSKIVYPNIPLFGGRVPKPIIPEYIFPVGAAAGSVNEATYSAVPKNLITKANKEGTDWFDAIFSNAPIVNHQIGVSGASDVARYAMSVNYFDQKGIMDYTNYKRISVRANTDYVVNKRIRVGENIQVAYGQRVGQPGGNQSETNPISFAYRVPPITPLYDIRGNFAGSPTVLDNSPSPLAALVRNKDNASRELRIFGNAYAEVDIIEGLTAKTQYGIDYNTFNLRNYTFNNIEAPEPIGTNSLTTSNSYDYAWTWYNTLSYNKTFADKHKINVLIGTEAIKSYYEGFTGQRAGFAVDDVSNRYLSAGRAGINNTGDGTEWSLASEFAKLNYSFGGKYLADLTVRRDRSSRFAKEFRSAVFPSASIGWVISQESFMKNLTWLSFAKLRFGIGQTGNQEIGNYNAFSTFATSPESSFYDLNGAKTSSLPGYELGQFGNANAKWETTTSTNFGIDANFLNNKLEANFDIYNRITTDMLFPVEVQFTQGVAINPFQNIGEMQNKGFELGLNYTDKKGDFTYSIGGNISAYRNTVIKTNGDPATQYFGFGGGVNRLAPMNVTQQGLPLASFFGYKIEGIFQTDKEGAEHPVQFGGGQMNKAGAFKFADVNGDKIINASDRTIIGNPHPDFSYGVNLSFGYKAFRLDVFGQGVQGNDLFNFVKYWTDFPTFGGNRSITMYEKSWRPGMTDAVLPIPRSNDVISSNPSTYYIENGSYFRLKNVQLNYTLPNVVLKKLGISSATIYVQAVNLATITKYSGLDPEVNLRNFNSGSDRQIGVDEGSYPAYRSMNIGLNLGF